MRRTIKLKQSNFDHNHLYLASIIDHFPPSSIGGSSEADVAPQLLEVHFGTDYPVFTDIAGDKKIFRKRAWVSEFLSLHKLKAGDCVVIERTEKYRYQVYPERVTKA